MDFFLRCSRALTFGDRNKMLVLLSLRKDTVLGNLLLLEESSSNWRCTWCVYHFIRPPSTPKSSYRIVSGNTPFWCLWHQVAKFQLCNPKLIQCCKTKVVNKAHANKVTCSRQYRGREYIFLSVPINWKHHLSYLGWVRPRSPWTNSLM